MKKTYTAEEVELMIDEIALSWVTRHKKITAEPVWVWNGNEEYAKKLGYKTTPQLIDHVYDEIKGNVKKKHTERYGIFYTEKTGRGGVADRYLTMALIANNEVLATRDAEGFLRSINKNFVEITKIEKL